MKSLLFVKVGTVKNGAKNLSFSGEKVVKMTTLGRTLITSRWYFTVPEDEVIALVEGQQVELSEAEFNFVPIADSNGAGMIYPK